MNKKLRKYWNEMIEALIEMVGEYHAGLLMAGLLDALQDATEGRDHLEMRSIKFVINDFFEFDILKKENEHGDD